MVSLLFIFKVSGSRLFLHLGQAFKSQQLLSLFLVLIQINFLSGSFVYEKASLLFEIRSARVKANLELVAKSNQLLELAPFLLSQLFSSFAGFLIVQSHDFVNLRFD